MIYIQALSFSFGDLKGWYNGYYAFDGGKLYNPWSVGNAFATGNLRPYWVESGNKFSYLFFLPCKSSFLSQVMIASFRSASTTSLTQITDFVHKSPIFLPTKVLKLKSKRICHIIRLSHTFLTSCCTSVELNF